MGYCSSYHELCLDWFLEQFKFLNSEWESVKSEWSSYKDYIDNYFDNLDVSEELMDAMNQWKEDGTWDEIINKELLNNIQGDVTELEGRTDTLETDNATNKTDIAELQEEVSELQQGSSGLTEIICVGDSYSTGYQPSGSVSPVLPQVVANDIGLTLHNYAVNASGYTKGGDTNHTFLQQLEEAEGDSNLNNNAVKYVLIIGGRNDASGPAATESAMRTAVENTIDFAKTAFPNAEIVVVPLWDFSVLSDSAQTLFYAIYQTALRRKAPVLTSENSPFWMVGSTADFYNGTDIHPNSSGTNIFGHLISNLIQGSDYTGFRGNAYTKIFNFTDLDVGIKNGYVYINGTVSNNRTYANGDDIATLPSELRPGHNVFSIGAGNNGEDPVLIGMKPDGTLELWSLMKCPNTSNNNIIINMVYPVGI